MSDQELQEILRQLEAAGLKPLLCDTPVPVCSCSVKCGPPTEPGDNDQSEEITLPKSFVGLHPEIISPAVGDSMRDAGLEEGDQLRVRLEVMPRDGDTVLAMLDGCYTVKAFLVDDMGQTWLVPRNEDYDAILITERVNARIMGVVIGVEKAAPHSSTREMMQIVRKTMKKMKLEKAAAENEAELLTDGYYERDIYIENRLKGTTKEISRSKVASVFKAGHSKKEIMENLYQLQDRNIDLLTLKEEERIVWINAQESAFKGQFKATDFRYFHDIDDEPNRRSRPPKRE